MFFGNTCVLPQFWNPLSVNFTFYPRIFACFISRLGVARRTQSLLCFVDLCWSCLSFWYECPVEAYLWFSSTCSRYHLCARSNLALVFVASSEQILKQHDSLHLSELQLQWCQVPLMNQTCQSSETCIHPSCMTETWINHVTCQSNLAGPSHDTYRPLLPVQPQQGTLWPTVALAFVCL